MIEEILAGDVRAIARAATAIENGDSGLVARLRRHAGQALVVGITGPPGAGKSTLVDALVELLRAGGKTVGVLAVDPTSPLSGGAILGDRIRMQRHHADPGVFIRSMATRGSLGGLSRATAGMVTLLDASGRDVILIETVGVGQAEVEIARLAGITVVVLMPGAGDDVQAIKAGLLEIADLFVINKADLPGAARLEQDLHSFSGKPIVHTVASEGKGIAEALAAILKITPRARAGEKQEFAIDHLGIAVKSIDTALRFYRDLVGLESGHRETVAHEMVHVAMLPVGDSRIELLEAADADSTIAKFIARRGEGLHHVALRVRDFDATMERLCASGARLLNEPRQGAGGHTYVFIHPASTGGVLLELIKEECES
jgi:LAO/AO transport system kinase